MNETASSTSRRTASGHNAVIVEEPEAGVNLQGAEVNAGNLKLQLLRRPSVIRIQQRGSAATSAVLSVEPSSTTMTSSGL
jgi:tmRNA-binding protein